MNPCTPQRPKFLPHSYNAGRSRAIMAFMFGSWNRNHGGGQLTLVTRPTMRTMPIMLPSLLAAIRFGILSRHKRTTKTSHSVHVKKVPWRQRMCRMNKPPDDVSIMPSWTNESLRPHCGEGAKHQVMECGVKSQKVYHDASSAGRSTAKRRRRRDVVIRDDLAQFGELTAVCPSRGWLADLVVIWSLKSYFHLHGECHAGGDDTCHKVKKKKVRMGRLVGEEWC